LGTADNILQANSGEILNIDVLSTNHLTADRLLDILIQVSYFFHIHVS